MIFNSIYFTNNNLLKDNETNKFNKRGIMKRILFFLLLIFINVSAQNLDSLETMYADILSSNKDKLLQIDKVYPEFYIEGEIKDRDSKKVLLFGHAFPVDNDYNLLGTVYEGNILITNYNPSGLTAGAIYSGRHRFTERTYSKNAFGADVPLYNYGNLIGEIQQVISQLEKDVAYISYRLAEIKEAKKVRKINTLLGEATIFYEQKAYTSSISKSQDVLILSPNNIQATEQLFSCYNSLAKDNIDNVSVASSFAYQAKDLNINNPLLKEALGFTFISIADVYFLSEHYDESSNYYREAFSTISLFPAETINRYAECEIKLGDQALSSKDIYGALVHYDKAVSLIPSNKNILDKKLDSARRSPFAYSLLSIIPGLGQLSQGNLGRARSQFLYFTISVISGYFLNKKSSNVYQNYLDANTEEFATSSYKEANNYKLWSYAAYSLATGILIYSIIDAFNLASSYNDTVRLSFSESSSTDFHPSTQFVNFSIKLNLW